MATPTAFPKLRGSAVGSPLERAQDNLNITLQPLAEAVAKTPIMGAPAPGWIRPNLQSGLVDTGGATALVGYHKDALTYVHAKGSATSAAGLGATSLLWRLDKGYRPAEVRRFIVFGNGPAAAFLQVAPTGDVTTLAAIGAGGTVDFELTFLAEQ